jgi:WD40 repeat protein
VIAKMASPRALSEVGAETEAEAEAEAVVSLAEAESGGQDGSDGAEIAAQSAASVTVVEMVQHADQSRVEGTTATQEARIKESSGVLIVTESGDRRAAQIQFWDAVTHAHVWTYRGDMNSCAFHQESNMLLCSCTGNTRSVVAINLTQIAVTYQITHASFYHTSCMSFNPLGTKFMTQNEFEKSMYVWDAATGRMLLEICNNGSRNFRACFSNDVDKDRIVALDRSGRLQVWSSDTGSKLSSFAAFRRTYDETRYAAVAMAANEPWCAACAANEIGVWNYKTIKRLFFSEANKTCPDFMGITFGAEDQSVISVQADLLKAWDIASGTLIFHCVGVGDGVAYSPSSRSLFVIAHSEDSTVHEVNVTTGEIISTKIFDGFVRWIQSYSIKPFVILM